MVPPTGPLNLDVEAISGICGSISIAAWVVVFSPQIIENFRRSSADGLSVQFIIAWLWGDIFNILGAVLQGVLPTMLILAVYYTIADVVLLGQCFYYRGFTWGFDEATTTTAPQTPVRSNGHAHYHATGAPPTEGTALLADYFGEVRERRGSGWSHLSPAVPMMSEPPASPLPPPTKRQAFLWNAVAVLMVCAAGALGWFLSRGYARGKQPSEGDNDNYLPALDLWGQIFGWLCAVLYLGSRLPQLLLNFRRKSTEGISMLFFLFACLGNLTYVLSIFAYDPACREAKCRPGEAASIYARYLLVNASWLAGSLGTLVLDLGIFAQFFVYDRDDSSDDGDEAIYDDDDDNAYDDDRVDQRPLLARGGSDLP
ncbi:PQ loop repeat-domain-containing protein [Nemania sp. NC0429]|nr:PQ loop repeat-domain-containing protein [Nemania sp. NC0429]